MSTTVVYSSGPVTLWMQKRPSRRSEKNPSSIQKRAVSTSTSAPCSSMKPRSPLTPVVLVQRVRDVRVDVVLRGARRVPRRRLAAVDRAPRVQRAAMAHLGRPLARRAQHPAAELQHLPRPLRARVDEERDDVDLRVPEVVALVAAAGDALGRDAVALGARGRLQQLEQVEADRPLELRRALDLDVAALARTLSTCARVLALDRVVAVARARGPACAPTRAGEVAGAPPQWYATHFSSRSAAPGLEVGLDDARRTRRRAAAIVRSRRPSRGAPSPHASSSPLSRVASRSSARVPSARAATGDEHALGEARPRRGSSAAASRRVA